MTQKVVHLEPVGKIILLRNKRSRKLRMTIKPDKKVVVSFPYHSSFRDAFSFAQKNTDWIIKQQKKIETVSVKLSIGSKIETKFHTIHILDGITEAKAMKNGNQVKIYIPTGKEDIYQNFLREVIEKIYRAEASVHLPDRLGYLSERFGFHYNRVTIRNNKRNWGSCSSKNSISLNLQMMKLPDELIDYILLHELVHTIEKNHGPGFWELLDKFTGNRAKELAKKVRKFSPYSL